MTSNWDQGLINQYLNGHLSDAELDNFEELLLTDSALCTEVEIQKHFKLGLKAESTLLFDQEPSPGPFAFLSFFVSPAWSLAASVVAIFSLGILVTQDQSAIQAVENVVRLEQVRGETGTWEVTTDSTLLLVDAFPFDNESVTISIVSNDEVILSFGEVEAASNGYYNIVVAGLEPGAFTLRVGNDRSLQEYGLMSVESPRH